MSTSAQRMAELRDRRKALGLVRLDLYVRPEHHAALKKLAAKLSKQTKGK